MGQKQTGRFCAHCQKRTLAVGTTPNHVFHLILTLVTMGLWLIVWLLVMAGRAGGFRCGQCGSRV